MFWGFLLRKVLSDAILSVKTLLMKTKTPQHVAVLASLIFPLITAALGSYFTSISVTTWYTTLEMPLFTPPSFVFGPVWTLLYLTMGVSFYLMLTSAATKKDHYLAVQLFIIQLVMNAGWCLAFFALMNPLLAIFGIIALDMLLLAAIMSFLRINRTSAYLLIPYFCWILFATYLNLGVVVLAL